MQTGRQLSVQDKWRLTSLSNKIISIATIVISLASILQFGTALFQWSEMHDAGKQTDRIVATTIANDRLEQRACVEATAITLDKMVSGSPPIITVAFINSGRTPALHVNIVVRGEIVSGFEPSFRYTGGEHGATTIQPGAVITTGGELAEGHL